MLSDTAWSILSSTSMTCAAIHRRRASSFAIVPRVQFNKALIESSSSAVPSVSEIRRCDVLLTLGDVYEVSRIYRDAFDQPNFILHGL